MLSVYRSCLLIIVVGLVSACAAPPPRAEIYDPQEASNRAVHKMNKAIDRSFARPAARGVGQIPKPVTKAVENLSGTLRLPGAVVNDTLQLRLQDAMTNGFRLLVNLTFGLGGVLDPATDMGILEQETDFGETLHVWGAGEGAYVELPFIGPSTTRDTVGMIVDTVLDPVGRVLNGPQNHAATALGVGERLIDRSEYSDLIDGLLYESEDSYAQARLFYLQNRRRQLIGELTDDDLEDPYAEF